MTARYDIHTNIHHAMRACMGETLTLVGRIDVNDRDDLMTGLQQLHELLNLCDAHISKEIHFVHAAMEVRRPDSTAAIADQHIDHTELMHIEDTEHNAVLWADYSDAELMHLEGEIIASIPPDEAAVIFRWMLPGIDHPARAALLNGVRQGRHVKCSRGCWPSRGHISARATGRSW